MFAVGNDGHFNVTEFTNDWSPWAAIGSIQVPANAKISAAVTIQDGLLHAFVVQDDGQVFGNWRDSNWHDWTAISGSAFRVDTKTTIAAASTWNKVYLFATGSDGKIYQTTVAKDSSDYGAPVDATGTVAFCRRVNLGEGNFDRGRLRPSGCSC